MGGACPTVQSLTELFAKIDANPNWLPGKHGGRKRGPEPVLTKAKRHCIANAAMTATSARGEEPYVDAVVIVCPAASSSDSKAPPRLYRCLAYNVTVAGTAVACPAVWALPSHAPI